MIENPHMFVLSGGPGAGKTTVLLALAKLGYRHAPEVAREIIREQVQSGGSALPWADRQAYTQLMLARSIASFREHTPAAAPMFADRGIPDTLSYARLIGLAETADIEAACRDFRYAPLVFLAPPWREIYTTDTERKQDFKEAIETYELLALTYREYGYRTLDLPRRSPEDRARFILRHL